MHKRQKQRNLSQALAAGPAQCLILFQIGSNTNTFLYISSVKAYVEPTTIQTYI